MRAELTGATAARMAALQVQEGSSLASFDLPARPVISPEASGKAGWEAVLTLDAVDLGTGDVWDAALQVHLTEAAAEHLATVSADLAERAETAFAALGRRLDAAAAAAAAASVQARDLITQPRPWNCVGGSLPRGSKCDWCGAFLAVRPAEIRAQASQRK